MPGYWVTIRGIAEQAVFVNADSKREARELAAQGIFDHASDFMDWVRNDDGTFRHWAARVPVESDD